MTCVDISMFVTAAALGGMVGTVELFQKYKAEPLKAVTNPWGLSYVLFNTFVSLMTYSVFFISNSEADQGILEKLQWAFLCGLGAVTVLRAKLMTISSSDGKDVALGPEIIVQTFLKVIDRELDRDRANKRFDTVRQLMTDIDYEKAKIRLPIQIFQAMQGVSEEETVTLMAQIEEVDKMEALDSQDKSYLLGFYLLDLVGEKFLRDLFKKYHQEFSQNLSLGPKE